MEPGKASALLTIFFISLSSVSIAQQPRVASALPKAATPVPNPALGAARAPSADAAGVVGAVPSATEAEMARQSRTEFQKRLADLTKLAEDLKKRIDDLRRQAVPPTGPEQERVNQELRVLDQEAAGLALFAKSPLDQLQQSELLDRLFEIRVALEIMNRRWGAGWNVLGLDFFQNVLPAGTPAGRSAPANYRIRVGDRLRILSTSQLGQQSEYPTEVDKSGCIVLSGAGRVSAVGKTAREFRDYLADRIKSRFKQIGIEVTVEKIGTIQVQVTGEVARPGTYVLGGLATVFDALYQAGGPTRSGTFRRISLVRDGAPKRNVDLYDLLLHGNKEQDLPLEDGDLIFVGSVGPTITVAGEVVRPGRYEPDFPVAIADVLKMAGGAKSSGYLQTVQVERVVKNEYVVLLNRPVAEVDGQAKFVAEPGDEITVLSVMPDRTNQVSISGPVASPGMFGLKENMRVSDLVAMARGLAQDREVYGGRGDILRVSPLNGLEILSFNLDKALKSDSENDLPLQRLDQVFVYEPDQVVFRPRLVTVTGAVARPGTYRRAAGMRVSDIVAAAGGVLPDAYLARADLTRHDDPNKNTLLRIDLESALTGDPASNHKLDDRDEITVYTLEQAAWRDRTVRVEGAVQRPGVYQRSENMRLSDLLFVSGGLLPEAQRRVEVAHCDQTGRSRVIPVDVTDLALCGDTDLLLSDQDVVTVPAVSSYLRSPEVVFITGEVANPGPYSLNGRSDKIADLVSRAGGLTEFADLNGMLFLRQKESFENVQQGKDVDIILQKSRMFADKQFLTQLAKMGVRLPDDFLQPGKTLNDLSKPAQVVSEKQLESGTTVKQGELDGATSEDMRNVMRAVARDRQQEEPAASEQNEVSAMGPALVETSSPTPAVFRGRSESADITQSARISVNLTRAMSDPHSPDNMILRNGDRVFVPRITNVVTVIGAVLHPHSFAAGRGKGVDYYIERSGGYAQDAARGHVIVVRANGDALPKNRVRSVEPGDMVVVPNAGLIDVAKKWEKAGNVTKVISEVLSTVFVLTRF